MKVLIDVSLYGGIALPKSIAQKLFEKDKEKYFEEPWEYDDPFSINPHDIYIDKMLYQLKADEPWFRADPYMIQLVEEIGVENSVESQFGHQHKIVEIPDGVDFYIYRPDVGAESIHEKHRSWS